MQPLEKIDAPPVQDYLNITEETGIEMELALQILSHLDMEARSHLAITSRSWNVLVVSETNKEELKRVNSFIPALIGQIKGLGPERAALYAEQIQALETLLKEYNTSKVLSLKALTDKLHTFRDKLIPILKALNENDLNKLNLNAISRPFSCEKLIDWIRFENVINSMMSYHELIARFVKFHDLSLISRLIAVHEQKYQDPRAFLWGAILHADIMQKNPEVFRPHLPDQFHHVIENKMRELYQAGDYEGAISLSKLIDNLSIDRCFELMKKLVGNKLKEKADQFLLTLKNNQAAYVAALSFLDLPTAMLEAEKLSDPQIKTDVFNAIADILWEKVQYSEAKEVAQKIPDENRRNYHFRVLSEWMVIRKQDVNEALKTALLITDQLARSWALRDMCLHLERRKEFDAAATIASNIPSDWMQTKRLMFIVNGLIANKDIDKALKVAQMIEPGSKRNRSLQAVAEAFKTAGRADEAQKIELLKS